MLTEKKVLNENLALALPESREGLAAFPEGKALGCLGGMVDSFLVEQELLNNSRGQYWLTTRNNEALPNGFGGSFPTLLVGGGIP